MKRWCVGIDLGTTHTVTAACRPDEGDEVEVVSIPQLVARGEIEARPLLPSALYAPLAGESDADPWGDAPWIVGELARRRGAEVPGRLVASAKSWLCHAAADRTAAILPWGAQDDAELPRLSPLDASARVLGHARAAWDAEHGDAPLAEQDIVLTVPASFDETARELTVEAARRAGLSVRLLEEPQAAFYEAMWAMGEPGLESLLAGTDGEALVLVCDVGGGTTDLSLIRVRGGARAAAGALLGVEVERVAVGRHLLLGGDNMDLALAHRAEPRLAPDGARLDPGRFAQLVLACRAAKERLLGDDPPDDAPVTVLGHGARLVGSALSTRIGQAEVGDAVLEAFFPTVDREAVPERSRAGLLAFGLPYERDAAITRHVAHFFARHAPAGIGARALLLNGGVFKASRIARRLADAVAAWSDVPLDVLPGVDPDLAVATGAVRYALALSGRGRRIQSGLARGYYVGVEPDDTGRRRAVCVVPRGAKEGERHVASDRPLALRMGRAVRFDLYAREAGIPHAPGEVVEIDDESFSRLVPIAATFATDRRRGPSEIRVALEGELSAIGTLELACVELGSESPRRLRLAFMLSEPVPAEDASAGPKSTAPPRSTHRPPVGTAHASRVEEARTAVARAFSGTDPREARHLSRELERILGERPEWSIETTRALFDALAEDTRARKRSADHERVFWALAGYCLRPGFGHPADAQRVARVAPLFTERLAFAEEARSWQQFWIAWRRIAGGLEERLQTTMRDALDPFVAPAEEKLKKPKGLKPEAMPELLELASSLERVAAARRGDLGGWVLERTWTDRDPRLWAAIGRLGARVPAYASLHHVVSPAKAESWLDHLLREKWIDPAGTVLAHAAVRLARATGDRARDISDPVRSEVVRRLEAFQARESWVRTVREVCDVEEAERADWLGEGLPLGLRVT